jgi:hypothetical protein
VVVLNASDRTRRVRLAWPGDGPGWRLYRYDPARVIHHPFGDLPAPAAVLGIGAAPEVTVPARGWALLTTDWHDRSAAAVTGLKRSVTDTGRHRLEWEPGDDSVCYYRIYRRGPAGEQQAGTTIATAFEDDGGFADDEAGYRVVAVNDALNTGDDAVV